VIFSGHAMAATTKKRLKNSASPAEYLTKDIEGIMETAARAAALREGGMTKTVVTFSLLRIGKNGVSFGSLFEALFGLGIALVAYYGVMIYHILIYELMYVQ